MKLLGRSRCCDAGCECGNIESKITPPRPPSIIISSLFLISIRATYYQHHLPTRVKFQKIQTAYSHHVHFLFRYLPIFHRYWQSWPCSLLQEDLNVSTAGSRTSQ